MRLHLILKQFIFIKLRWSLTEFEMESHKIEMESHKIIFYRLFLFLLGLTAMATQVILIREAMAVFQGNELIIGLFMGIWMLLTAAGALISSKFKVQSEKFKVKSSKFVSPNDLCASPPPRFPASLLSLLSILPLLTLFFLIFLRFAIVPAGIMAGLGQTLMVISVALIPLCLVSGMLFPIVTRELSLLKDKNLIYQGYALDSAGSILGGLLFSLAFLFLLSSYQSLIIIALLNLTVTAIWFWKSKKWIAVTILSGISLAMIIFYLNIDADKRLANLQYPGQKLIETMSSPYGKLAVTRSGDEYYFFENGGPVAPAADVINNEESVHYAMLLHKNPVSVLLISGGSPGVINEILKYPVSRIDYVEPDPWLMELVGKYRKYPEDNRIRYIHKDPRIYLHDEDDRYDVIIINTPEPNSASMNRFYTVEFFNFLKEKMNEDGILGVPVSAAGNYMSETSRMAHSVMYNSLKGVFPNIRIIPGYRDHYLASYAPLDHSLFGDYDSLNFINEYVNPSYVDERLVNIRSNLIMSDLLPDAPVNSDLRPYVFSVYLDQWLARFKTSRWIIPVILIAVLIAAFICLGPLNLGLFTGGFTASSLEFILLLWFQGIYGFVYQMTGAFFAVFMAGMALGSLYRHKIIKKSNFYRYLIIQAIIALFSLITAALLLLFSSSPGLLFFSSPFIISLVFFLIFINGSLTGIQFSLSAFLRKDDILKSSGESFSADLLGSAIGIILISVYFVPMLGLPSTGIVLAGLNLGTLLVVSVKGRRSKV